MIDLSTHYLGLKLKNPLVVSASPISKHLDGVRRAEEAGAAAVVMYSLFEEQIEFERASVDYYLTHGAESHPEALTYFPYLDRYNGSPDAYVEHLARVKAAVDIPVIGSLNGATPGGWVEYARKIQEAGADALELNLYYLTTNPERTAAELEETYLQLVRDVRAQIAIPLAVKLSPFFTALPNLSQRFVAAGANGLVLFNRFYQPDFDLESLEVVPQLTFSTSDELRLPLRWIAIMYGRVDADFALTSGVHSGTDVIKAMMAGAQVAMLASELLSHGVKRLGEILAELPQWMELHDYQSIEQMQGSMSQLAVADPAAFERANYMKILNTLDHRLPHAW